MAAFPNMPERITTTLDRFDFDALVGRLRLIANGLKTSSAIGTPTPLDSAFMQMPFGMRISFRRSPQGMLLRTDPDENMSAMTILETDMPDHGRTEAPKDPQEARAFVARWLAMLALPRFRTWGCQTHGDHPCDALADRVGAMLVAHNPKADGLYVSVPLPNPYRDADPIMVLRKPAFTPKLSEMLVAGMPVTAHVSKGGGHHDYNIGVPADVNGQCTTQDALSRLRLLAETAHVSRPLLKAGREAGR